MVKARYQWEAILKSHKETLQYFKETLKTPIILFFCRWAQTSLEKKVLGLRGKRDLVNGNLFNAASNFCEA